jgi:hypothetical protein
LESEGIGISRDGRGRVYDNIFVKRFWRTVKYEEVYLRECRTVAEARDSLAAYFRFYNEERLHETLGYRTPHEVYFGTPGPWFNMGGLEIVAPRTSGEIDSAVVLKKDGYWASARLKRSRQAGLQCNLRRPLNCPDNGVYLTPKPFKNLTEGWVEQGNRCMICL